MAQEPETKGEGADPGAGGNPPAKPDPLAPGSPDYKSMSKVVEEVQSGKRLPKWASDLGYKSVEEARAAMEAAKKAPEDAAPKGGPPDPEKFTDDYGAFDAKAFAKAQTAYLAEATERVRRDAMDSFNRRDQAGETEAMEEAMRSIPADLAPDDDARALLADSIRATATARLPGGQLFATKREIGEATARIVGLYTKAAESKLVALAAKARANAGGEPPDVPSGAGHKPEPKPVDITTLRGDERQAAIRRSIDAAVDDAVGARER